MRLIEDAKLRKVLEGTARFDRGENRTGKAMMMQRETKIIKIKKNERKIKIRI